MCIRDRGWGGLGGLGFGAGAALDRGSVAGGELGGDLGLEAEGVAACFADFPGQLCGGPEAAVAEIEGLGSGEAALFLGGGGL